MPTHIYDRRVTDVRDDPGLRLVLAAADPTTERAQDSMVQLVRQGLDTSLRSGQVWADLARQASSTALDSPTGATMTSLAHDPFEGLLAAQREIVAI